MFCMKCGQSLPDDALFCSSCGTKTLFGQNTSLEKELVFSKTNTENEEMLIAKKQAEKEREEKIKKANEEIKKTLTISLEETRDSKSIRVIIFGCIAGFSGLVALLSFASISSGEELTVELIMTAAMSFAISLGVLCGLGIICRQYNETIRQKEMELKRFDDEIKYSKGDF